MVVIHSHFISIYSPVQHILVQEHYNVSERRPLDFEVLNWIHAHFEMDLFHMRSFVLITDKLHPL